MAYKVTSCAKRIGTDYKASGLRYFGGQAISRLLDCAEAGLWLTGTGMHAYESFAALGQWMYNTGIEAISGLLPMSWELKAV